MGYMFIRPQCVHNIHGGIYRDVLLRGQLHQRLPRGPRGCHAAVGQPNTADIVLRRCLLL